MFLKLTRIAAELVFVTVNQVNATFYCEHHMLKAKLGNILL